MGAAQQEAEGIAEPELWSPEDPVFFDASHVPAAHACAPALASLAAELRALGFVELGWEGAHFTRGAEGVPEVSVRELGELEAAAARGESHAVERLEEAKDFRRIHEIHGRVHYCWQWVHPTTHDVASIEHVSGLTDLEFRRLFEDGRVVRTLRRPPEGPEGFPAATGTFLDARLPGLYRLFVMLAGDAYSQGRCDIPAIGVHARILRTATVADTWAAHCAAADAHAGAVATPDMELSIAFGRRLLHVLFVQIDQANRWAMGVLLAVPLLGRIAAGFLVGFGSGNAVAGVLAPLVVPWLGGSLWAYATASADADVLLLPALTLGVWAWWLGLPPALVGAAVLLSFTFVAAASLLFFWIGQSGRIHLDRRLTSPRLVGAGELRILYRA